ncbi:MAG: ATP-binding protein [Steroidobacteraceae bacterium]
MSSDMEQFHGAFFEESLEAIDAMEAAVLRLAPGAAASEIINTIFRTAHSIKGGASMFGFSEIASFTHTIETLLDELRAARLLVTTAMCDGLLRSVDVLRSLMAAQQAGLPLDLVQSAQLQQEFMRMMTVEQPASSDTAQFTLLRPASSAGLGNELHTIRVDIEKVDRLLATVDALAATQAQLLQIGNEVGGIAGEQLRGRLAQMQVHMGALQEAVTHVRRLPLDSVFSRLPRLVRDLSTRLGKPIQLLVSGAQAELDKTMLEMIGDPLVHLLRNSVDHGIETSAERLSAGKPAEGIIRLDARHRGDCLTITVSDDGRGLNAPRLIAKARAHGLIDPQAVLSDAQAYELIFMPGLTTAERTTDVSGRGVGMDIVRRNITELGGGIELRSQPGRGTTITITLPLARAAIEPARARHPERQTGT